MALGNGGFTPNSNTDNNKKNFDPTVYCPVMLKNPEAQSDPSELSFSYWKNLLKISISPKMERRDNDKYDQYDHNNNASIYLNSMKARILATEIKDMIKNPGTINSVGVNSGTSGLITFSNGTEFGIDGYVLVIRKLDENGTVISSYMYQFNGSNYYNSIRNFNESSLKFDKQYFPMIEVTMFIELLENYAAAQNYAVAYTVVDSLKFDFSRINTKIESIMGNLGIQLPQRSRSNNGGKSFFDASKEGAKNSNYSDAGYGSSSNTTSLEDVAAELE